MSRYDRSHYFESLCELRRRYAAREIEDRAGILLMSDAMIYAEAIMAALDTEIEDLVEDAESAAAESAAADFAAAESAAAESATAAGQDDPGA